MVIAVEKKKVVGISSLGIALVVTQLFRLLFGGYLVGFDLYYYNDSESALTVLLIYLIIGFLTALFLLGRKKSSLIGLIAISVFMLFMESVYLVVYYSQPIPDASLHDPMLNIWASVFNFLFPILTLLFAIMIYREN